MSFTLEPLPYDLNALAPLISQETLEYHYGKHHQTYVNNLNALNPTESSLEEIIEKNRSAKNAFFNNAAQIWNHTFYWNCLAPLKAGGGGNPTGPLAEALIRDFGSLSSFREKFIQVALKTFGSGWAWLVKTPENALAIISTSNADTPIGTKDIPLLTCDVWEHSYYIDYRNARAAYVEAFWKLINWDFVSKNLG
jgi:superoxide dismutase, Fe-Mn family